MKLVHLPYKEIDLLKWDQCIKSASHPLIYGLSNYLTQMSPNWEALVLNDYETVMPLCHKKKWGISYLYQPAFVAQMGIFGKSGTDSSIVKAFVDRALEQYRFMEVPLNYFNSIPDTYAANCIQRNNFTLSLNDTYEHIAQHFSGSHSKNIKRSAQFVLKYEVGNHPTAIIQLFRELYSDRKLVYQEKDYQHFEILCNMLAETQQLIVRKVTNEQQQMMAGIILLKDEHRLYNVMSCVTTEGRKKEANYFLFQQLIQEFCNQNLLIDFEGSDVPGIANFYAGFGAINEPYPFLSINQLPALVKLFKQ